MNKKEFLSLLMGSFCLLVMGDLFGQETTSAQTSDLVPCPEIDLHSFQQLLEKGEVQNQYYKEDYIDFSLYPKTELGSALKSTWTEKKDPVFVSESLFLIEKPEGSNPNQLDTELISKIMRSISTMEGIQYYSNSDGRMKTLYSQSYTIDNPDDGNKIPDNSEGSAEGVSIYAFQEDGSLGENYYQIEYKQRENEVSMVIRLIEPLKFGIITAVKPNNLIINIDTLDKGQYLVMYIGAKVNFPALSLFEKRLSKSFGARIDALYGWFKDNYLLEKKTTIQQLEGE